MTTEMKKVTQSDLNAVVRRSNLFQGSWNFERMQALDCLFDGTGYQNVYTLIQTHKNVKMPSKRHLEFFNTQPFVAAPVLGVTIAMEEERANGKEIDDAAINGIKVGLMGPLAGVGDPIYWGTARPVFAALGAGLAINGNILGPILFFVLFNLVRLATRYFGVTYGYKKRSRCSR